MAADLRYKVTGPFAVAGARTGETIRVGAGDVDELGRHAVVGTGDRILLAALLQADQVEPLSKAAGAAAGDSADE